jgi:hypothetical protein
MLEWYPDTPLRSKRPLGPPLPFAIDDVPCSYQDAEKSTAR